MHILVTGASGSGTSTFGRALAEAMRAVWVDADDFYWMPTDPPFAVKRERADRLSLILARLNGTAGSVVSGSVVDWGSELEDRFGLVVFLTVTTSVRLERLRQREVKLRGVARAEFLEWAAQYDDGRMASRSRAVHERWLATRCCPILRIAGEQPVEAMLHTALGFCHS